MVVDHDVISCDEDVLGGTPVFAGTRVPITTLFDYLVGGSSLDEFFEDFPTVTRAHVTAVLEYARACVSNQQQELRGRARSERIS